MRTDRTENTSGVRSIIIQRDCCHSVLKHRGWVDSEVNGRVRVRSNIATDGFILELAESLLRLKKTLRDTLCVAKGQ